MFLGGMMKFTPRLWILMIVFMLVIFAPSVRDGSALDTTPQSTSTKPKTMHVDIKLFSFKPESLEVPVGTTVIWTNRDAIEHSVTQGTPEKPRGAFDSGFFTQDQTFSFTFTKVGDYPYFCKRHNFMRGEIKVIPTP
jgi:plastocyanin